MLTMLLSSSGNQGTVATYLKAALGKKTHLAFLAFRGFFIIFVKRDYPFKTSANFRDF